MRINPDGEDLGWFAIDQDGHVGFFTSAGSRVVPELVLESREAWESLDKGIQALPRIGKGKIGFRVTGNREHWIEMAERGLFAYDFKSRDTAVFEKGDYERVAVPSHPIIADSLDKRLLQVLRPLTMSLVSFAKENLVKEDLIRSL